MRKAQTKNAQYPFSCNVLGAKHGIATELVLINVIQRYDYYEQSFGKTLLGQSFIDCPQKDHCGIYEETRPGFSEHNWNKCPAKKKYP